MPDISVLLPVFNGEKYIKESINSLLIQSYKDFELVIIDDGSTDNTASLVKSFDDSRIHLIQLDQNNGTANALNAGWSASDSRYVALMDHDDIAFTRRLELQIRMMNGQPRITAAGGQMRIFGQIQADTNVPLRDGQIKANLLSATQNLLNPTMMIRRNAVEKIGVKWDSNMKGIFDWVYWCELMLHKATFANLPDILLHYRSHESQQSRDQRDMRTLHAQTRLRLMEHLFPALTSKQASIVEPLLQWTQPPGIDCQILGQGIQILQGMMKQPASSLGEDRVMLDNFLRNCHQRWSKALTSFSPGSEQPSSEL